jgi:hypothetical protein
MDSPQLQTILALRPRLDPAARARLAHRLAATNAGSFRAAIAVHGPGAGLDGLIDTAAGVALMSALAADKDVTLELQSLGLLASRTGARAAIERLTAAGMPASDPRLDILRLNAALNPLGAPA